jgi:hypothetical protein
LAKYRKIYASNQKAVFERTSHLIFLVIICAGIFSDGEFRPGHTIGSLIYCLGLLQRFLWIKYIKREFHSTYKKVRSTLAVTLVVRDGFQSHVLRLDT